MSTKTWKYPFPDNTFNNHIKEEKKYSETGTILELMKGMNKPI